MKSILTSKEMANWQFVTNWEDTYVFKNAENGEMRLFHPLPSQADGTEQWLDTGLGLVPLAYLK